MHIKDISISSLRHSNDGKTILGDVIFLISGDSGSNDQRLKLVCETAFSPHIRADAALIGSAIRKLRQLPGVRSGLEKISFEPGMRPLATTQSMDSRAVNG